MQLEGSFVLSLLTHPTRSFAVKITLCYPGGVEVQNTTAKEKRKHKKENTNIKEKMLTQKENTTH